MGLEAVVGDIQEKGKREAEAIRVETQREVERILREAQKEVEAVKVEAERKVMEQIERVIGQDVSAGNLIVKRKLLNTQRELLDRVYQETLAAIGAMPESFHRQVLGEVLEQAAREIPKGTIFCNRRDLPVLRDLIAGKPAYSAYTVGDPIETEGGIIVESSGGGLKIDLSYRTYLDRVWEGGLKDAADILFA
ncbi:MAG: V-type ATP synthase subunit E [Methanomicrobiales archaeon]|nr:V-type ATP synthase subunit E [Methanomicrobiales archaeon]